MKEIDDLIDVKDRLENTNQMIQNQSLPNEMHVFALREILPAIIVDIEKIINKEIK